jgi:alanine racemase
MVDIGNDEISVGDDVTIIGKQGDSSIYADELAKKAGTITYEVLTSVTSRVPRIYTDENDVS